MKTLIGLNEKPVTIEDNPSAEVVESLPSFRRLLKIVVGNCVPKKGTEEAVDLYQLGMKLKVEGDVQLEDAEFKLLNTKLKDNPTEFTAHILGQLLGIMDKAEKGNKADLQPA